MAVYIQFALVHPTSQAWTQLPNHPPTEVPTQLAIHLPRYTPPTHQVTLSQPLNYQPSLPSSLRNQPMRACMPPYMTLYMTSEDDVAALLKEQPP